MICATAKMCVVHGWGAVIYVEHMHAVAQYIIYDICKLKASATHPSTEKMSNQECWNKHVCVSKRAYKCALILGLWGEKTKQNCSLPLLFFSSTCSPKDSTDEFNLSKTDLNVFLLPSTVSGRRNWLQEPEETGPWLLKVLQQLQGHQVLAGPPAVASVLWNFFLDISSASPHAPLI